MKKTILLLLAAMGIATANAQVKYEPEFIGETNLLCINDGDTTCVATTKEKGKVTEKAGASVYLVGIGEVKSRIHIDGITTNSIGKKADYKAFSLVVRGANNNQDPNSFITILKFDVTKKARRCVISKESTFGGVKNGIEKELDFQAKRYGEASYLLNFNPEPGEYGVMVTNPENKTEKNAIVYTFTIK
ncbi:MAG: hypothetical protein HUK05_06300 [Prevotella sp.]|nr:hypothetical protein [Prevotella sp.]MCF0208937.1 hypothetical protein [Bacteroidaceae bacterium]